MRIAAALALAISPTFSLLAQPVGPEFRVNTFTSNAQDFPAVASESDGSFVVVWADMLRSVLSDGPRAVLFSLAGVVILVAGAFFAALLITAPRPLTRA